MQTSLIKSAKAWPELRLLRSNNDSPLASFAAGWHHCISNDFRSRRWPKDNLKLSLEIVRFGNISDTISRQDLAIYLLAEFRHAVWISRCRVRIDNAKPAAETVIKSMHARIINRIIVDKSRLGPCEFMEQWVLPGFAHFNNKGHLVITLRIWMWAYIFPSDFVRLHVVWMQSY